MGWSAASGSFAGLFVGTTVLREIGHQCGHRLELGPVADRPTTLLGADQARSQQFLQVEGERGTRQAERLGNVTGQLAASAGLYKQAEDRQAGGVAQGSKSAGCSVMFHDSRIIESIP